LLMIILSSFSWQHGINYFSPKGDRHHISG
jgi:hypothetical protein